MYQLIYADQADGGYLWAYLRHPRRQRKPHKPAGETRGRIPNRTSIDERPDVVDEKRRFGDLMEGAKGSGYLLTLVERTTAYTLIDRLGKATVEKVTEATTKGF